MRSKTTVHILQMTKYEKFQMARFVHHYKEETFVYGLENYLDNSNGLWYSL